MPSTQTKVYQIFSNYCEDEVSFEEAKRSLVDDDEIENPTDEQVWERVRDLTNSYWDDEKYNLQKFFNDGSIFVLTGFLGLWDGKHPGGFVFKSFEELEKVWQNGSIENVRLFDSENGRFHVHCLHHDGTNQYEIKKLTKKGQDWYCRNASKKSPRDLCETLFHKKGYSSELKYMNKVYGCKYGK